MLWDGLRIAGEVSYWSFYWRIHSLTKYTHIDITGILKCVNVHRENAEHSLRIQSKEPEICIEKVCGNYEIKHKH